MYESCDVMHGMTVLHNCEDMLNSRFLFRDRLLSLLPPSRSFHRLGLANVAYTIVTNRSRLQNVDVSAAA